MRTERRRIGRVQSVGSMLVMSVAALASCSVGGSPVEDRDAPAAAPTTRPVQETTAGPVDDYGTVDEGNHREVAGPDAPVVDVGFLFGPDAHPGTAVLVFEPIAPPVECITGARLDVTLVETALTPVAVYPGDPASVATSDGAVVPHWATLLDNRPRGTVDVDRRPGRGAPTSPSWCGPGPRAGRSRRADARSMPPSRWCSWSSRKPR